MTREEFKILVKAMKAVYTHPSFIPDQYAFDVWYEMMKDLDYKTASSAVKKYMLSEEKDPTVSGIRKHVVSISGGISNNQNESEAWQIVWKAVRKSGDYDRALKNFNDFPTAIQRAVGSPSQLKEWALTENLNVEVVSSNFMRTYRQEVSEEKERRKMSPEILKIIENNIKKAEIEENNKSISISEERELAIKDAVQMPDRVKQRLKEIL